MSHKSAKKVRRLLRETVMKSEQGQAFDLRQREYIEDGAKRKRQLVELKNGTEEMIDVSYGQITNKAGSGRAVYRLVKKAMGAKA